MFIRKVLKEVSDMSLARANERDLFMCMMTSFVKNLASCITFKDKTLVTSSVS
jgi:hypothetical protein